ncbi:MAG: hypothetical protein RM368_25295 [Nostoc sp. DedSLP03]|nr:hypothetical protein [Nostoc sp. DedSLP03]
MKGFKWLAIACSIGLLNFAMPTAVNYALFVCQVLIDGKQVRSKDFSPYFLSTKMLPTNSQNYLDKVI